MAEGRGEKSQIIRQPDSLVLYSTLTTPWSWVSLITALIEYSTEAEHPDIERVMDNWQTIFYHKIFNTVFPRCQNQPSYHSACGKF
jgi:hypothetical protein